MKNIFDLIFIVIMGSQVSNLLGWWGIIPVALLSGWMQGWTESSKWWVGTLSGLLLWAGLATIIHIGNEGILTEKIAKLFSLPSSWLLVAVTGFFGAVIAGLSRYVSILVRENFFSSKRPKEA